MKRLVAIALIAACNGEEGGVDFPIVPGGGGGPGGMGRADAAVDAAGDASTTITGRVCLLVANLRALADCAPAGAGNLTVTLGTATTTTNDDGTFTLMRPAETNGLSWSVTGAGVISSAVRFGSTVTLPAFDAAAYQEMIALNNVTADESPGLVVRVSRLGAPVEGALVDTVPEPTEVYYDRETDATWSTIDGTGPAGVAWIPRIVGTSAQITVTSETTPTEFENNALFANTVTFVFAEIP